jgi:hypothetical protein
MNKFPEHKIFFVLLEFEKSISTRPFAVTIYKDYSYEDLYATIVDELSRQADGDILFDVLEEPDLILDGMSLQPQKLTYEMFKSNHVYNVNLCRG